MYPKVLLLGNGLNLSYGGVEWGNLIKQINCNSNISYTSFKDISFPLQAVFATGDNLSKTIKNNNDLFYGLKDIEKLRSVMERILSIPFDHIITTNYSYEIERIANTKVDRNGAYCKKLARHTKGSDRVESKYLLHSYNEICFNEHIHKVWHIHGEARKPDSIVLGHYYYGNLLSQYYSFFQKRRNVQAILQQDKKEPKIESWLDAYIMGDVYVLGFGYDLSEMDMWWLLNRKKREKANHGKTILYEPSFGNEIKETLFCTYDGKVENLNYRTKNPNYAEFYNEAISAIESEVLN